MHVVNKKTSTLNAEDCRITVIWDSTVDFWGHFWPYLILPTLYRYLQCCLDLFKSVRITHFSCTHFKFRNLVHQCCIFGGCARKLVQAVLRNRNCRNRYFLLSETGTVSNYRSGTVSNYGSRTVIKWNHKSWQSIKFCIWFLLFHIFSFTFYNQFYEAFQFFLRKKTYYVKRQDFCPKIILKPVPFMV